jgi:flagellar protein FliS
MAVNPYEKMRQNAILTTPKEELTLMLYDGALRFLNQAISALEKKDYVKTNEFAVKTQNIIREFQLTLDRTYEVSNNLATLYDYIHNLLWEGNVEKSEKKLDEARTMIRELRDTWKEAIRLAKASHATADMTQA